MDKRSINFSLPRGEKKRGGEGGESNCDSVKYREKKKKRRARIGQGIIPIQR